LASLARDVRAVPFFSVVIPSHNRRKFIGATLESVYAQQCTDYEVIVVDDGSTDGTREWLASHGGRGRVREQSNRGPGAARNLGLWEARGEYVAFLDSDDLWFPWTLDTFATLIARYNSPAILSGKLLEFRDEKELLSVRAEPVRAVAFTDFFSSAGTGYFVGAGTAVLRRDVLLASGGFIVERVNAEDHDLIMRLGMGPGFIQILAPVTLGWRRHGASETASLKRTFAGIARMVEQERRGTYPGGSVRGRQRRTIVAGHARPASLGCLRAGLLHEAWQLYAKTFSWQARQGRWRYLAAFPLLAMARTSRRSAMS
jgi:cellulose synthase/poly-beta-1,6-N-acetylglucosamine synthase-like glycosyltransferase